MSQGLGTLFMAAVDSLNDADKANRSAVMQALNDAADDWLNNIFTQGVPVGNDGGAALQTAWKAYTS